jgi:hypothetical protein
MKKRFLTVLAIAATAFNAHALLITPSTTPQWSGDDNSNLTNAQISAIVGNDTTEVYKKDVGGSESSGFGFGSSYETTFLNSAHDPSGALIEYTGGPTFGGNVYLYVKDGNQSPAFYIFDITSWDRMEDLVLQDFWPQQGAISHIAIYDAPPTVPDGGATLALFGLALGSIGMMKKRFFGKAF